VEVSAVSAAKASLLGMDGDATVGNVGACWALVKAGVEVVFDVFGGFSKDVFYLFAAVIDLVGIALFRALMVAIIVHVGMVDVDAGVVTGLSDITIEIGGDVGISDVGIGGEVSEEFIAYLIVVGEEMS
jgi:hypothetical protein